MKNGTHLVIISEAGLLCNEKSQYDGVFVVFSNGLNEKFETAYQLNEHRLNEMCRAAKTHKEGSLLTIPDDIGARLLIVVEDDKIVDYKPYSEGVKYELSDEKKKALEDARNIVKTIEDKSKEVDEFDIM